MFPLISILIPAYNCEEYIDECIHSCFNQTYPNIEIIVVNDGSKDNTLEKLDLFKKNITIINKQNEGVVLARLDAFKKSIGEYVFFLDSDDYLPNDAIEVLYAELIKGKFDIVCGRTKRTKLDVFKQKNRLIVDNLVYSEYLVLGKFGCGLSAKLFKRSILSPEELTIDPRITNNEDKLINLIVSQKKLQILLINRVVYYYRYNENSASQTFCRTLENDYIYINELRKRIVDPSFREIVNDNISWLFYSYAKSTKDIKKINTWRDTISYNEEYLPKVKFQIRMYYPIFLRVLKDRGIIRDICLQTILYFVKISDR